MSLLLLPARTGLNAVRHVARYLSYHTGGAPR